MSKKINFIIEDVFKTDDIEKRKKNFEEALLKVIRKSENYKQY